MTPHQIHFQAQLKQNHADLGAASQYFVSALLGFMISMGLPFIAHAESESRLGRDASGMKEAMQNDVFSAGGSVGSGGAGDALRRTAPKSQKTQKTQEVEVPGEFPTWSEIAEAYDKASASWLQVYGEKPFDQARPWAKKGALAMKSKGWLDDGTHVVISMLDGRGDMAEMNAGVGAEVKGAKCRAQVNIDEHASSPVIRALGGFGSSISFVVAHELAHCHFDTLSKDQRLPSATMMRQSGASPRLTQRMMSLMSEPSDLNGGQDLVDAYDEALADAAAAIALRTEEEAPGSTSRFGSALERAQAVRFGAIAQSMRGGVPAEVHQGAFTFGAVNRLPTRLLNWDEAKKIAFQSVLASSLVMAEKKRWFKDMILREPVAAVNLAQRWKSTAQFALKHRNLENDEGLYRSASSPALFTFSPAEGQGAHQDTPAEAMSRWKKAAWIYTSDLDKP